MTTDQAELCYLSAGEAIARFSEGGLSPVDVLRAQIARSERVEPAINAFTETYFDAALAQARLAAHHYWSLVWGSTMMPLLDDHRDELCDYTVWFLQNSRKTSARDYSASLEVAVRMYDRFGPLMDEYDLFVCPTLTTTGVPNDCTWPEHDIEINGAIKRVGEEFWSATYPFNMLSRCPVLAVPSGLAANGVPTGIQMVARSYDDQRVFTAALAYEQACERSPFQLDARIDSGDSSC